MEVNKIYQHNVMDPWPLPDESVNCIITSPPYFNLRDYECEGQLGLEKTPEEYVENMVKVFREARRVLKNDGTLWINIGDSYASSGGKRSTAAATKKSTLEGGLGTQMAALRHRSIAGNGIKVKDLIGIPWMLAFALRADGWYLRCDIVWAKKNCMPESVTDRPTKSHEYIFLLSKSDRYYYDHEAIKEPSIYDVDGSGTNARRVRQGLNNKSIPDEKKAGIRPPGYKDSGKNNGKNSDKQRGHSRKHAGFNDRWDKMSHEEQCTGMRNKRDVWWVAPAQFPDAHFATFPGELISPPIKAGCPPGGIVLDCFFGSGTVGAECEKLGRNWIGLELSQKYIDMAQARIAAPDGMFKEAGVIIPTKGMAQKQMFE